MASAVPGRRGDPVKKAIAVPEMAFAPIAFRRLLATWYQRHARALPWRGIDDPYATWVSEIMLQQTRVATVVERYKEFLERFPTLALLAAADEAEVLALWSGLGYYRRARMLRRGAEFVVRELGGVLPRTAVELRTLPGVGAYTSAAIASIAFREAIAVVDGNVERVLLRVLGKGEGEMSATQMSAAAQSLVPRSKRQGPNLPGEHNQAMMELGATLCVPRQPLCLECPVVAMCATRGEHSTSARPAQQSRVVAHLLALRKRGVATEVLLQRRALEASLMPGMLELPPLPLTAVASREPVLRLRHAITNTNFYVEVYSESAPGLAAEPMDGEESDWEGEQPNGLFASEEDEEDVFVEPEPPAAGELLREVPAAKSDLVWTPAAQLPRVPLTGLTRKVLQRLKVMAVPRVRLG